MRFLRCACTALALLTGAGDVAAQCSEDSFRRLRTRQIRAADVDTNIASQALGGRGVVVNMSLSSPSGSADIDVAGGPTSFTLPVSRWVWRLVTRPAINPNDLEVRYRLLGDGALTSTNDPFSVMAATFRTVRIEESSAGANARYDGIVEILVHPLAATQAGRYRGRLQVEISCR